MIQRVGFAWRNQKFQHTGWWDHEMCSRAYLSTLVPCTQVQWISIRSRILEPCPVPKSFPLWIESGFSRGKNILIITGSTILDLNYNSIVWILYSVRRLRNDIQLSRTPFSFTWYIPITSSNVSHWRLKQQPIGITRGKASSFLGILSITLQSLWISSNWPGLHSCWYCTTVL
jgi:hypothetical protein